jgi:hypothetical protein
MRRHFYLFMVMVLAFWIIFPLNSTAETPLKLRLMTETGDMITTNEPVIKNFFMSSDGVLAAILDSSQGGLNFTFAADETHVGIRNGNADTSISNYVVTVTAGKTLSFEVFSETSGASITALPLPGGSFNSGTYQWTTTTGDLGTYLAVFQATSTRKTSQVVVMIKIVSSTPTQCTLAINVSPSGVGTVTGAGSYNAGSTATVTASANSGYTFSSWSEGTSPAGSAPTSTTNYITMNSSHTITANFTQSQQQQYTLNINVSPSGVGTVTGAGSYNAGSTATVTASANSGSGYTFSSWSEGTSPAGSAPTSTTNYITMNSSHTITANFTQSGGGSGTYSQQVASAVKLNQRTLGDPNAYGYYSGPGQSSGQYTIPLGATVWFLIDPKSVVGTVAGVRIQFTDFVQGDNLRIDDLNSVLIYAIDPSDNLYPGGINPKRIDLSGNTATWFIWGHNDNKRYLIKVTESGSRPTPYNIYWNYW